MKKYIIIFVFILTNYNTNLIVAQGNSIIKTNNVPLTNSNTRILGKWYDNSDGSNSQSSYWEFNTDGKLYIYSGGVLESVFTYSISHSCGQNSDPKFEFLKTVDEDGYESCAEINGINENNSGILSLTSMQNFDITLLVNDINIKITPIGVD